MGKIAQRAAKSGDNAAKTQKFGIFIASEYSLIANLLKVDY